MTVEEYRELMGLETRQKKCRGRGTGAKAPRTHSPSRANVPNANEKRFLRMCLADAAGEITYEPTRFILTQVNKRRYTPDFRVRWGGKSVWVEVKDSYHLQSEQRAHLAFELAAENYSRSVGAFIWARWDKKCRGYQCEAWFDGGARRVKGLCRNAADFVRLSTGEGL